MFFEFEGNEYYAMVFVPKGWEGRNEHETALLVYYDDVCNEGFTGANEFLEHSYIKAVEICDKCASAKYHASNGDGDGQTFDEISKQDYPCCVLVDNSLL